MEVSIGKHRFCMPDNLVVTKGTGRACDETKFGPMPAPLGNHFWYYDIVSRENYVFCFKNGKMSFALAPNWSPRIDEMFGDTIIILRPRVSRYATSSFVDLVRDVVSQTNKRVLMKQVLKENERCFIEAGYRRYKAYEGWSRHHRLDDQSFPEVVCLIDGIHDVAEKSILEGINSQARRIYKHLKVEDVSRNIDSNAIQNELRNVFEEWRSHFAKRYSHIADYMFVGWNTVAIEKIKKYTDQKIYKVCDTRTGEMIAFFHFLISNNRQFDLATSFYKPVESDIHKLAHRIVFQELSRNGVAFVNLGGSEEETLFESKKKIWKNTCLEFTHLIADW